MIQSLQSRAVREFITSLSLASVTLKVVAGKTFTEHGLPELASSKLLASSERLHQVVKSKTSLQHSHSRATDKSSFLKAH